MRIPPSGQGITRHDLGAALLEDGPSRPSVLRRGDGLALLYAGALNTLFGEPGGGKSWLAVRGVAEVLASDGRAVVLDYEDVAATWAARLVDLGVSTDVLAGVAYFQVAGQLGDQGVSWLCELITGWDVKLVVVDSLCEALAGEGSSENDSSEVARFLARVPRPLARAGAAVLLLDHVSKLPELRGRWARGSTVKLSAIDGAAFGLVTLTPFCRSSSGHGQLVLAKDRPGFVGSVGDVAAEVRFVVEGGSLTGIQLDMPGESEPESAEGRRLSPEEVLLALRLEGGSWSSLAAAAKALRLPRRSADVALRATIDAGFITEVDRNGARSFQERT